MSFTPPVHQEPSFTTEFHKWDWLVWLPALSVAVFIRRDIGIRMFRRVYINGAALIIFIISLGVESGPIQHRMWGYAVLVVVAGFFQFLKRKWEFHRFQKSHSFYLGTSPFAFRFLPEFVRRKRIMERAADPCFVAATGLFLLPILGPLGLWLAFAACALMAVEGVAYKRMRDMQMDMMDGLVHAEYQGGLAEKFEDAPAQRCQTSKAPIATGLGDDIAQKLKQKRRSQ